MSIFEQEICTYINNSKKFIKIYTKNLENYKFFNNKTIVVVINTSSTNSTGLEKY